MQSYFSQSRHMLITLLVVFFFTTLVLLLAGAPPFSAYYYIFIGILSGNYNGKSEPGNTGSYQQIVC